MEESFNFMFQVLQNSHQNKQPLPWACPVCDMRFKWDVQLLRHQRQTGHENPDRQLRKIKKANKLDFKECGYCKQRFIDQLERLSHYPWCQHNPNSFLAPYRSISEHYEFECTKHFNTLYFKTANALRQHIKTHRQKREEEKREEEKREEEKRVEQCNEKSEMKRKRGQVGARQQSILRRQCSKIRVLKKKRAQQIAQQTKVSISTVRRYHRMYKKVQ